MKNLMLIALILVFTASGVFAAKSTFDAPGIPMPTDTSSTPDAYGYTWVDNDNDGSPVYNWIDITGIGTLVEGLADDNAVGPYDIGFDFAYYWYIVDQFYIGSNGYISFSSNANYSQAFPMIPNTNPPNDLVVPLAADLDFTAPYGTNECYYYTNNTDTVIVSWIDVLEWDSPYDSTSSHTFQLILCKTDSSITYQYGAQNGDFMNTEGHCQIGIEDLLGSNGIRYMFDLAPPNRMPHDGLVIRIHADPDPDFIFHDSGVAGAMNEGSGGIFRSVDRPMTLSALVQNYGTMPEDNITVNCQVKRQGTPGTIYNENTTLAHLESGETVWVNFPVSLTPDEVALHSVIFRTTMTGDQFYFNNLDTCEMRTYNASIPTTFTYADTAVDGTSWQGGGGGFANEFIVPDQVTITGITAFLWNDGVNPVFFHILADDGNGNPDEGNILFADTMVFADTNWIYVPVSGGVVIPPNEKFFISTLSGGLGIAFGTDPLYPLSKRGWENTGSYAPSRDRSGQDMAISFVADIHVGIDDENASSLPVSFNLHQNYPNPFNANTEITFDLASQSNVILNVYNIAGQKISNLANGSFEAGTHKVIWNGTSDSGKAITSGVYFYHIEVDNTTQTKKMVLLK